MKTQLKPLVITAIAVLTLTLCNCSSNDNDNENNQAPKVFSITAVTDAAGFSKRVFHTSVVFDDKIWVIAGRSGGGDKNGILREH